MCGRYSLGKTDRVEWGRFGVPPLRDLEPHWNIAPGAEVVAIRNGETGREAVRLRWGLIPAWAQDPAIGHRLVNARAESANVRPAFKDAFGTRRCLLPADGFYEWQVVEGRKVKQPWRVEPRDGGVLAIGGLWERWSPAAGAPVETCTILTVPANHALAHVHDRMPVLVAPDDYAEWLAPETTRARAQALCRPAADELLRAWTISLAVNTAANDGPGIAEPSE